MPQHLLTSLRILFQKNIKLKLSHPFNTCIEITFPLQIVFFVFVLKAVLEGNSANIPDGSTRLYPIKDIHRESLLMHDKLAILSNHKSLEANPLISNFTRDFCPCQVEFTDELNYLENHWKYTLGALDIKSLPADIFGKEGTRFLLINRTNIMDMNQTRRYADVSLLDLQYRISSTYYSLKYPGKRLNLHLKTQEIPETTNLEYINMAAQYMYPFYFAVSALNVFHPHLVNLVSEKKLKLKSMLSIVGCSMLAYNLSWYLISALQVVIIMVSTTLCIYVLHVFRYTNALLFMVAYFLYLTSFLPLAHIFSVFFSEPKSSSFVSQIAFMMCLLMWAGVRFFLQFIHPWWLIVLVNFFSPFAFLEFMFYLVVAENNETGLTFSNLSSQDVDGTYDLRLTLLGLFVDNILYFFISHYVDKVVPEDSGRAKPFYYFLQPSYWRGWVVAPNGDGLFSRVRLLFLSLFSRNPMPRELLIQQDVHQEEVDDLMEENFSPHEDELLLHRQNQLDNTDATLQRQSTSDTISVGDLIDEAPQPSVQIRNLTRVFKKRRMLLCTKSVVKAVDDLSLDLYNGINAVTGHNGAGKSTILRLLTSQLAPTRGKIFINGLDIDQHWPYIRERLCVCPQDNVLWDKLSCADHLQIIGQIKGVPKHILNDRINEQLKYLDLFSKKYEPVENLSGGQKRRLCFLMSMIGSNPGDILILDEISCGVDVANRRKIWNMLQDAKKDRTIILITHSMEEADYLADNIAIMKKGKLEVCGNSLFLKKHYSVGYTLRCTINNDVDDIDSVRSQLRAFIKRHIPEAKNAKQVPQRNVVSFRLPYGRTSRFSAFFKDFEAEKSQFSVKSFALSVNTLEEIFVKVTEEIENQEEEESQVEQEAPRQSVHQRSLSELTEGVLSGDNGSAMV
mmetsp:Transcript_1663/g.5794  ORF Transcript_1663/g.5794 Transcript_1663/m.5794 type:complete len:903 (-) Transcript_1663:652-3360(-)|eukprot:CAMPEP_0117443328 /NCGR_PEP_ID=MMETSP0759-20121206/4636_1 /TAXON_ID=63605 /ORGANISM="Percolomonas cosmopolitus, Strain WS" /LENGTH=902 /DNA_ID=CAMNT_0005235295 /DNA_START=6283 /DNA_END=8991 /DNA_ORIENTATION=-